MCKIVSKSELNARNKSKAYNELAVAKIIYSAFGVIKWTRQKLSPGHTAHDNDTITIQKNHLPIKYMLAITLVRYVAV